MPTKLDTGIDALTVADLRFLKYKISDGLNNGEAYKKAHPKTKMGPENCRRAGWAQMKRIKAAIGSWQDFFEYNDVGPDRLVKIFNDGLTAEAFIDVYEEDKKTKEIRRKTIVAADHRIRLAAAKEIKEIHNLAEQTVNIKTDTPLPMVVIIDGEEQGEDDA